MPMWTSFWHLIRRSLVYFPLELSGNWLSVLLPFGLYVIREVFRLRKDGWRSMTWKNIGRDTWLMIAAYLLLFGWAVVYTVYKDHVNLVNANRALGLKLDTQNKGLSLSIGGVSTIWQNNDLFMQIATTALNQGEPRSVPSWTASISYQGIVIQGVHRVGVPRYPASPMLPDLAFLLDSQLAHQTQAVGILSFVFYDVPKKFPRSLNSDKLVLTLTAIDSFGKSLTVSVNLGEIHAQHHGQFPMKKGAPI